MKWTSVWLLRNVQTITLTFWLPLLEPCFDKNTRRCLGYAWVFWLVWPQNKLPIIAELIIQTFLSEKNIIPHRI